MDAYDREMMGSYHTYAQIESILQGIASQLLEHHESLSVLERLMKDALSGV